MKANTFYNDFTGTASADISDNIVSKPDTNSTNYFKTLEEHFKIDTERFNIVGINLGLIFNLTISLICEDKEKSTDEKKHIVLMEVESKEMKYLDTLFKNFNIVLHNKYDNTYKHLTPDEEVQYSDFHKNEIVNDDNNI